VLGQKRDGVDWHYVPQVSYVTGDIDIHDVAIDKQGRIVFSRIPCFSGSRPVSV